ncbi:hypothetical protein PENTCL1PPCAC_24820, partial [Pristionchus entomophagus]
MDGRVSSPRFLFHLVTVEVLLFSSRQLVVEISELTLASSLLLTNYLFDVSDRSAVRFELLAATATLKGIVLLADSLVCMVQVVGERLPVGAYLLALKALGLFLNLISRPFNNDGIRHLSYLIIPLISRFLFKTQLVQAFIRTSSLDILICRFLLKAELVQSFVRVFSRASNRNRLRSARLRAGPCRRPHVHLRRDLLGFWHLVLSRGYARLLNRNLLSRGLPLCDGSPH